MTRLGFRARYKIDKACEALGTYTCYEVYSWIEYNETVNKKHRVSRGAVHTVIPSAKEVGRYLCRGPPSMFVKYVREGGKLVKKYRWVGK